jgi:hypothetical protein
MFMVVRIFYYAIAMEISRKGRPIFIDVPCYVAFAVHHEMEKTEIRAYGHALQTHDCQNHNYAHSH